MRLLSLIISLLLIILGVSFSVLNSHDVSINYFIAQKTIYFPLLVLMLLFMGVLLGVIVMLPTIIKLKYGRAKSASAP
jgi:uncharacterized integral membrane protein